MKYHKTCNSKISKECRRISKTVAKRVIAFITAYLFIFSGIGFSQNFQGSYLPVRMDCNWFDTDGNEIEAQGGSIRKFGDTYYLYGCSFEKSGAGLGENKAVKCYSSRDLIHWKFENDVLTEHVPNRAHVVYNAATKQYVLFTKSGGIGVATCPGPTGNFKWHGVETLPVGEGGDFSIFQDDDQKAYVIWGCYAPPPASNGWVRERHICIAELTPDYRHVARLTAKLEDSFMEAPWILKRDGVYMIFGSPLAGWFSSRTWYSVSANLSGDWSPWMVLKTDPPSEDTYNSQSDFVLRVEGSSGSFFMYCGDRWSQFTKYGAGKYVWLPLEFKGNEPILKWYPGWYMNAASGTWTAKLPSPDPQLIEAENMEHSNYSVVDQRFKSGHRVGIVDHWFASGGKQIGITDVNTTGSASFTYTGESGKKKITVYFADLKGGDAAYRLFVSGELKHTWAGNKNWEETLELMNRDRVMNDQFNIPWKVGESPNPVTRISEIILNIQINKGDRIKIEGTAKEADQAYIDNVTIEP